MEGQRGIVTKSCEGQRISGERNPVFDDEYKRMKRKEQKRGESKGFEHFSSQENRHE